MKLNDALILRMSFNDLQGEIRVDENGYICLNDLASYHPHKKINEWKKNNTTKEFIKTVDEFLNRGNSTELKKSIISKRGKYSGGTYAHELIAMEFCTWLSPEFKMKVYLEYMSGRQKKKNWNVKRILAAYNYKIMSKSIKDSREDTKPYHYSNEARMLNVIVFGKSEKGIRDNAPENKLDDIAWLESKNSAYIDINMPYNERKSILEALFEKHDAEMFDKQSNICVLYHEKTKTCGCYLCCQHDIAYDAADGKDKSEWLPEMIKSGLTERESKRWINVFNDLGV